MGGRRRPARGPRPDRDEGDRARGRRAAGIPRDDPGAGDWERIRRSVRARYGAEEPPPTRDAPGLASLVMLLEAVRAIVPHELERQFTALVRELLLTLRALIDWYLERLEDGERQQRVEDIPIE